MADTLDLINTVRIGDLQTASANRDMLYDLDRRVERIERNTGERPMEREEFIATLPEEKPRPFLRHVAMQAVIGGLLLTAVLGAAALLTNPATLPVMIASGAGVGMLLGAVIGMVDDQRPEIDKKQLAEYRRYLDGFEQSHNAKAPVREPEPEKETGTKWQEHTAKSKHAEMAI